MIILGIPTLNQFTKLDACIDSALSGTVAPDVVIVVDNSGGRCPKRDTVAYIVPSSNMGVARAWNSIAQIAGDDAQLIISNDDLVFAPDTIACLLRVAEDRPRAGIVSAIEGERFSLFYLRRAAYTRIGPFDVQFWPAYFEDNDYHYRLRLADWESPIAPSDVRHTKSSSIRAMSAAQADAMHEFFRANEARYLAKWGDMPGKERFSLPYGAM